MVLEGYRDELARVFEEASRELAELPAELRDIGQALLSRSNPLTNGGGTNAISFLLPFWMRETTEAPPHVCHDLAVGNLYAMLHYFVMDDAMDGGTGRLAAGLRRSLALGQLLQVMYRERYARHFPSESPLWRYELQYTREWATAVNLEGETLADPHDRGQLAGKAAPVKLCAAGLLLWAGRAERISGIEEAVVLALAILQLSDDYTDWREDLAKPDGNAFLTIVREKLELAAEEPLDERAVRHAIYRRGCAGLLADIAEDYAKRLCSIPCVPSGLSIFGSALARDLREEAARIDESVRELALGGGWSHYLSKIQKM